MIIDKRKKDAPLDTNTSFKNNNSIYDNSSNSMKSQSVNLKKRNWAFILYPESAPKDWQDILVKSGIKYAISPLHDKDIDPTGSSKKSHYHIILVYGNTTTFNNVKSLTDRLNQPIPQSLEQIRGYYRYLTHLDNPDKYQYSDKDIQVGGGFDISDFLELSKSEVDAIKTDLVNFIKAKKIIEYSDFLDEIIFMGDKNKINIALNNTILFNNYIRSRRHKQSAPEK
ncbi:MAG: replication protein, partial [Clostridia bacterium]